MSVELINEKIGLANKYIQKLNKQGIYSEFKLNLIKQHLISFNFLLSSIIDLLKIINRN